MAPSSGMGWKLAGSREGPLAGPRLPQGGSEPLQRGALWVDGGARRKCETWCSPQP